MYEMYRILQILIIQRRNSNIMLKTLSLILIILALVGIVIGYVFAIAQLKIVAEPGGYMDAAGTLLLLAIATMVYDYVYQQE